MAFKRVYPADGCLFLAQEDKLIPLAVRQQRAPNSIHINYSISIRLMLCPECWLSFCESRMRSIARGTGSKSKFFLGLVLSCCKILHEMKTPNYHSQQQTFPPTTHSIYSRYSKGEFTVVYSIPPNRTLLNGMGSFGCNNNWCMLPSID